ncbi:2-oxoglutarate and iron-dependent oxygenase domain-containing protein 2-like isoform X2 [Haemaphysalis longicornis]
MKRQRFYRCACYPKSDIVVPELDMRVNYLGRDAFLREFSTIKAVVTARARELRDANKSKEEADNRCNIPLDRGVYELKDAYLHPDFLDMVKKVSTPEGLPASCVLSKEKEVYQIPLLTQEFADKLLRELDHFERSDMPRMRPNVLNNYETILSHLGFDEGFVAPLRDRYLTPLAKALFPAWTGSRLDSHVAFTTFNSPCSKQRLEYRFDNSEVSLDVCLGRRDFEGGELYFADMSDCDPMLADCPIHLYKPKPRWAVLRRGQQMHGSLNVTSGERVNLVLWLRSSELRNRRCPLCAQPPSLVAADGYGDGFTASSAAPNTIPPPVPVPEGQPTASRSAEVVGEAE